MIVPIRYNTYILGIIYVDDNRDAHIILSERVNCPIVVINLCFNIYLKRAKTTYKSTVDWMALNQDSAASWKRIYGTSIQ